MEFGLTAVCYRDLRLLQCVNSKQTKTNQMQVNTLQHGPIKPHALICAGHGVSARLLIGYYPAGSYHVVDYLTGAEVMAGRYFGRTISAAFDFLGPDTRGAADIAINEIEQDDVTDAYCRAWFERARAGRAKSIKVLRFKNA